MRMSKPGNYTLTLASAGLGRGERSPLAPLAGLVAGAGLLAPFITVEPATEPSGEDASDR